MFGLKKIAGVAAIGALALGMSACSEPDADSENRSDAHASLQQSQPAKTMDYSPTRETINYWVETWEEPGKLSYVYLQSQTGDILGYYVLEGLPVSYCAQISNPVDIGGSSSGYYAKPAPANDGAYYGGGGSCNTYYGKDATTGTYLEYTAGLGINVLLFSEPMPNVNHQELNAYGDAEVGDE